MSEAYEPIKTVFCWVRNGSKILLIQEGGDKNHGLWNMPGGHVDPGENLETAAARETLEEAGVKVQITGNIMTRVVTGLEYLSDVDPDDLPVEVNVFDGVYVSGEPKPGEWELDVKWFDLAEIPALPLRLKLIQELVENAKNLENKTQN